ncbi:glycosyltransferase [Meiothermus taiwanensis]|uniref:N-acetylgalactosamine-N, N'-diacetylbacillosaminyl-diphospho-undecaprenol 4-alpha-N-acetylgalactosaminyltransferase n=1 Tax=Meiothermus taiwanensis TaxID=172827 RepID=A0A399E272_9DEIN|nr:glycosyltransferase [Meiothermus taiwanensis]RIH78086.1 N-acetylgalactosamine-N,N'-diacetylbacillosaminyl-diphospho-undecaprenol 4-alpha-N-acetylgalactosaminyltransferase [Meiothermus taiwanensis]
MSKLSIFLPNLNGGGAERVMVTLVNGFAHRGYCVDLVLASKEGPYLQEVDPLVRVVDLRAGRVIKALWPLVRYLRSERPVAMLSAINHANVVAVLARYLARVNTRVVISEHSTISIEAQRARVWNARSVYVLVPWVYRRADGIVAVSRDSAHDLERFASLPAGSVQTIYNPFDLTRIRQLAAEPVPHPWLQPEQRRPVILAIGRLTEPKDYPTLLRAFALVRTHLNGRLLILGEGELREELAALAQSLGLGDDDFQMPGFVANPFAYLARAAVFVLSSRWEGLPGALIEAMACGTPVVSTDCPSGPREILQEGRWGRLVAVGDVEALAQAIVSVLQTPREQLPDVRQRAADFAQDRAIDAYLATLGLPGWGQA